MERNELSGLLADVIKAREIEEEDEDEAWTVQVIFSKLNFERTTLAQINPPEKLVFNLL